MVPRLSSSSDQMFRCLYVNVCVLNMWKWEAAVTRRRQGAWTPYDDPPNKWKHVSVEKDCGANGPSAFGPIQTVRCQMWYVLQQENQGKQHRLFRKSTSSYVSCRKKKRFPAILQEWCALIPVFSSVLSHVLWTHPCHVPSGRSQLPLVTISRSWFVVVHQL